MVRYIPLTRGLRTIVDDEDFERFGTHSWQANPSGSNKMYARRTYRDGRRKKSEYLHRLIMDALPGVEIDHINGDSLDNRRCNLRTANRSGNTANRPKDLGKSGYKGVFPQSRSTRWVAKLKCHGVLHHIGTFDTPEQAAAAYDAKALELWGEYARLNFPE